MAYLPFGVVLTVYANVVPCFSCEKYGRWVKENLANDSILEHSSAGVSSFHRGTAVASSLPRFW